jgi:hypothetical protein
MPDERPKDLGVLATVRAFDDEVFNRGIRRARFRIGCSFRDRSAHVTATGVAMPSHRSHTTDSTPAGNVGADGRAHAMPCATLALMASDSERDEFPPAELDRLYAVYNGRDASGGAAGIGIQARDRLIRKLIEEVRRLRRTRT